MQQAVMQAYSSWHVSGACDTGFSHFKALNRITPMRSIGLLAVLVGTLWLGSACSDGSGTPPSDNAAPEAKFDLPACTVNVPCTFISTSTDDVQVTEWLWDFDGDQVPDKNTATATFTFPEAKAYNVSLTVRDAQGLSNTKTSTITVSAAGNQAPVANFDVPQPCVANQPCQFVSTSTDDQAVTQWAWDFNGDQIADQTTETASFTFSAAGDYSVSLTAFDAQGLSDVETKTITVAAPAINTPPTAGFTFNCSGTTCSFTSTSTDAAPGTITAYAWNFGDAGTADVANPQHVYVVTAPRTFDVSLTVTDNEGATATATQSVSVAPPPAGAEGCVTKTIGNPVRNIVDCAFNVPTKSTMKVTILDLHCENIPGGQRVVAPPPINDQMFLNVCTLPVGSSIGIFGGPLDELIVYEAGSQVVIRFFQGFADGHGALWPNPPSATFEGTYPDWTMRFEDGSQAGQPGEPDFADVVIGLHATPK
jgi:PKD repeat protein